MTYNKFSNGGLFNQISHTTADEAPHRSGAKKVIGVLLALMILAAAGAGFWFL